MKPELGHDFDNLRPNIKSLFSELPPYLISTAVKTFLEYCQNYGDSLVSHEEIAIAIASDNFRQFLECEYRARAIDRK